MKRLWLLLILIASVNITHSYTGVYIGWENFLSPILPMKSTADNFVFGFTGTTPTRVYFYYNMLGNMVFTKGAISGQLGWGIDLAGGVGYRFMNAAYKYSGWDLGLDFFTYLAPYFLNSETGYTETAIYYGVGLGFNTVYKFNPHIGIGLRVSLKYLIGSEYLAANISGSGGLIFSIGTFLTF